MSVCLAACKLEHINSSPHFSQTDLFETLKSNIFEGITGSIVMNKHASREGSTVTYYVTNVVANQPDGEGMVSFSLHEPLVHRGSTYGRSGISQSPYFKKAQTSKWEQLKDQSSFIYSSSTTSPPIPISSLETRIVSISRPVQIVGLSIGAVPLLTSVFCFIWTLQNKSSRVVRSSQPFFLYIICVGCFIMSLAIVPMSLKDLNLGERILGASCKIGPWFYIVGFSLAITALHTKTSRLNTILERNPLINLPLSSKHAILKITAILLFNVIMLTAWTITSENGHTLIKGYEPDEFGRTSEYLSACMLSNSSSDFLLILFLSNVALFITIFYEAYKTKHLAIEFTEGKYIVYMVFVIIEMWILGAVIFFDSRRHPDTFFLSMSWINSICSMTILSFVFGSKIHAFIRMDFQSSDNDDLRSLFIYISQYRSSEEASVAHSIRSLDIAETVTYDRDEDESDITN